jgi:peptidoglycan/LPS O-acetylase OafA/YrhL
MSDKKTIAVLMLCLGSTIFVNSIKLFILFSIFYATFYFAVSGRLRILKFKPLVYLGGISYSLYLLHQNIGYVIINKFYDVGLSPWPPVSK